MLTLSLRFYRRLSIGFATLNHLLLSGLRCASSFAALSAKGQKKMDNQESAKFRGQLGQVEVALEQLDALASSLRPERGDLRWFAESKIQAPRERVQRSTRDALNHAATLIGYFDGYDARGLFQVRTEGISAERNTSNLGELLSYLQWVVSEIRLVIGDLQARPILQLCVKGPKKPGPARTGEFCLEHLSCLQQAFCTLFQDATSNDNLLRQIEEQLVIRVP